MRTRENVIDFIRSESVSGNSIAYATLGNGGSGLTVSSYDFSDDLEDMDFDGKVEPCEDILRWRVYDPAFYETYQFSDDNGLKIQVVTF